MNSAVHPFVIFVFLLDCLEFKAASTLAPTFRAASMGMIKPIEACLNVAFVYENSLQS